MKNLYLRVTGALAVITLLWFQAESNLFSYTNFFQYRNALVQYSGILAITLMALVMVLALRIPFIEKFTRGLDKSYHLHKWLGISALLTAVLHWLFVTAPKYMVQWGMLEPPVRPARTGTPEGLEAIMGSLRSGAEGVGEWAFYGMLILGVVSLLGVIGYKTFKLSHKLMAVGFLVIAYHGVVLLPTSYWPYPITYLMLAIITCGVLAAIWSLSGKIGKKRTHQAKVVKFSHDDENHVTDLRLSVEDWPGHTDGQFAYLNFGQNNIHPFTIASTHNSGGQLRFLAKELGDFTQQLKSSLTEGQVVAVEGPYGRFDFNDDRPQIWIGGGIGIAAFKATLQQRNSSSSTESVTLYYCTNNPSTTFVAELEDEAKKANITLRLIDGRHQSLLDVEQLVLNHSNLQQCSIWFCGPKVFSNQLKKDLALTNYDLNLFHQEYFSMR